MSRGAGKGVGFGLAALVPVACCVGLPLLVGAGASVAAAASIGGLTVGVIALAGAVAVLAVRSRAKRQTSPPSSEGTIQ